LKGFQNLLDLDAWILQTKSAVGPHHQPLELDENQSPEVIQKRHFGQFDRERGRDGPCKETIQFPQQHRGTIGIHPAPEVKHHAPILYVGRFEKMRSMNRGSAHD
jgi:hypothetical protein